MDYTQHQINIKKSRIIKYVSITLTILVLIVSTFFVLNILKKQDINYKPLLADTSKDIVYERNDTNILENDKVPFININNTIIDGVNDEINELYEAYLIKYTDYFTYEYNVSGNILSIIIKNSQRYADSNHYTISYKSYNINLKTFKILSDEEIYKEFNLKEKDVEFFVAYKFLNYYNDLVDKKIIDKKECDFNCFLKQTEITNYLSDNSYYINDNKLELYKYFNTYDYYETGFFNEESFHFIVKK